MTKPPLTSQQAKDAVFEHWQQLNAISRRRFPNDENLALEGVDYVLKKLESDDWRRIRAWEGQSEFAAFVTLVAVRLLTDFSREKFGHRREPGWLRDKDDPLWDKAYRLLIVKNHTRQETIEILQTSEPNRDRRHLEEIVTTIQGRCQKHPSAMKQEVPLDDWNGEAPPGSKPEEALIARDEENLESIASSLLGNDAREPPESAADECLQRLRPLIQLTDEDRLLLRLHFIDGLSIMNAAKLVQLNGDPYKRFNKIIKYLRTVFQQGGIAELLATRMSDR